MESERDRNLKALSLLEEPVRRRLFDWVRRPGTAGRSPGGIACAAHQPPAGNLPPGQAGRCRPAGFRLSAPERPHRSRGRTPRARVLEDRARVQRQRPGAKLRTGRGALRDGAGGTHRRPAHTAAQGPPATWVRTWANASGRGAPPGRADGCAGGRRLRAAGRRVRRDPAAELPIPRARRGASAARVRH